MFWVGAAGSLFLGFPVTVMVLTRLWRSWIAHVADAVARVDAKTTPNGGMSTTLGDRVLRVEEMVQDLHRQLVHDGRYVDRAKGASSC